jgi:hypothetical protein
MRLALKFDNATAVGKSVGAVKGWYLSHHTIFEVSNSPQLTLFGSDLHQVLR